LEYFTKNEIDLMLSNGKIEICPLAFMRGRTFKNTFIIADEMQNSSPNQMKMLTTRLGSNSRLVITGDLKQSDIKTENGLNNFIVKLNNYQLNNNVTSLIKLVEFNSEDIERSEVVQKVIEIYDYEKKNVVSNNIEKTQISINDNNNNIEKKINIKTSILENKISHKKNVQTNDAALIPKHHYTHNFDIFFESRDF
jgi:phosphate starvation-inducible protein PhoH